MIYFAEGNRETVLNQSDVSELVDSMIIKLGKLDRILLLPPDFTRYHAYAGEITCMIYEKLKDRSHIVIMPTVGTHMPMSAKEINTMYPGIPHEQFISHNWQKDTRVIGTITPEITSELTDGVAEWPVRCEINKILVEDKWDQIISIGQLVPHELIGIANHNKNIFVGAGGKDIIGKTHMIAALYGTEKIMGKISSPVRNVLNYMSRHFIQDITVSYIMTVRGNDHNNQLVTRGIFAGDDEECYLRGARLCRQVNINVLDKDYNKVIAYLDPDEFKSFWVGNKALLRTRMCIADGGELIILCPGIESFGENQFADSFIRRYGYINKDQLIKTVKAKGEFDDNLIPLSQMIISDTEKRFSVIYAAKKISREEIESVYCRYADYDKIIKRYNPFQMKEGENIMPDGEEVFFVSKPAQGLWVSANKFS